MLCCVVVLLLRVLGDDKGKSKGRSSRLNGREGEAEEEDDNDNGPILPRHRTWEEAQAAVDEADR